VGIAMNEEDANLSLIRRFRARAEQALPGRITRVVLFGSRARREAHPRSDWDVTVFLRDGASTKDALELADAAYDLIVETGQTIHPIALSEDGQGANPLLLDRIDIEGVTL
jgi:predicted nucleotidyltransferase